MTVIERKEPTRDAALKVSISMASTTLSRVGAENTGAAEVEYAVVVDAKYTTRIQDHHWNDTRKYRDIRATQTRRQVVYQLWLAYPNADEQVEPEDSAITWTERGPDCQRDEFIWGRLGLIPPTEESAALGRGTGWIANAETTANRLVQGLLAFLGMTSFRAGEAKDETPRAH